MRGLGVSWLRVAVARAAFTHSECARLRGRSWASLYQQQKDTSPPHAVLRARSAAEERAFRSALSKMQLWYAHQKLYAILVTHLPDGHGFGRDDYWQRGWVRRCSVSSERSAALSRHCLLACSPAAYPEADGSRLALADVRRGALDECRQGMTYPPNVGPSPVRLL